MKNLKKIVTITLVILMLASTVVMFNSCGGKASEATIEIYMPYVVNLDPAVAYADDASAKVLSLLYEGLTTIGSDGKVKGAIAESWKSYTDRDGNKALDIKLKKTEWSDGTTVDAEDFLDSWERILNPEFNCQAASLLYPIKNAAAVKCGDMTLSDLGIRATKQDTLTIILEDWANVDTFLRNCASVALYPIRKDVINKIKDDETGEENDWSTLVAILANNGPFYLKTVSFGTTEDGVSSRPYMILERNLHYFRNTEDEGEALDEYVLPYRIHINMTYGNDVFLPEVDKEVSKVKTEEINARIDALKATMTEEELNALGDSAQEHLKEMVIAELKKEAASKLSENFIDSILSTIRDNKKDFYTAYQNGEVLYNNALPLTEEVDEKVVMKNSMMTGSFLFNTENELFSDARVREALSLALDREEIAQMVKYAKAADTLVTDGVFNTSRKTSFKDKADYGISTTANEAAAKALLEQAGVTGGAFSISVRSTETDIMIANYAATVWGKLGFDVSVIPYGYNIVVYTEKTLATNKDGENEWVDEKIYDGLLHDNFVDIYNNASFDVIFYDVNMLTTDAFPVLAQFATMYSGRAYNFSDAANFDIVLPHVTGYASAEYDALLQQAISEKDAAKRAELLHSAEKLLLKDLPITPVIYYQNAYIISGELEGCKNDFFGATQFDKAVYENYVAPEEEEAPPVEGGEAETTAA